MLKQRESRSLEGHSGGGGCPVLFETLNLILDTKESVDTQTHTQALAHTHTVSQTQNLGALIYLFV